MMASTHEEIAVIGSGCRFPSDANTPSRLWELIENPRDVAQKIDRFNVEGFYNENGQISGHSNVKHAYLLTGEGGYRSFDAGFFGISPLEANVLDPQTRLLLETVYEALESAGQTLEGLRGSDTAVYAGQMTDDYAQLMGRDPDTLGTYQATGVSRAMLSNRISYFFDWHGPSMTLDTACSSSLVALHLAVQQLRSGYSRVAIATGSNLLLDPQCFIAESSLRMLSPNGKSRMWDAGADGYARGEGVAAVVLKTLSAAEADGDDIECIIRHTALNQDGKTSGITMPSAEAQTQLIRDCYTQAGLDPLSNPADRPQYFECHGTGRYAGDAQEAEAIYRAFFPTEGSVSNIGRDQLFVGGAKTVIGHSEGAAGLAGVLKASLALQKSVIPPNLLLDHLNPRIQPFYHNMKILKTASAWPDVTVGSPRRASVNSFGFGGTNAHAILESYCAKDLPGNGTTVFTPFVFSAASEKSLARYLTDFATYARANGPMINLRDLSYTLSDRRSSLQVMSAISASSHDDLCAKLETMIGDSIATDTNSIGTRPQAKPNAKILGVFTGQGAQWATMGTELITKSAAARNILESLEGRLSRLPPGDRPAWSLKEELLKPASSSRINEAAFSQPLCTAVQILQVELLRVAGVAFSAVVGHSSGEIAAAFAAGLISSEAAICIAYYRGLYSSLALGPDSQLGSMMAVGTSAEDVQELCDDPDFAGRVYVAAQNSPQSVTLSGDRDAVEELEVVLKDERKFVRVLKVDKAYHSHHVKPCSEPYLKSMKTLNIDVTPGPARCAWFSTVYGGVNIPFMAERDMLKGPYWARNMEQPVLLMQAVQEAWVSNGPFDIALEIGPHPTLKGPVLQTLSEQSIPYTSLFVRGTSAIESMSEGLGYILSRIGSASINLRAYDTYLSGNRNVRLLKGIPSYSWNHDSEYWHESRYARTMRQRTPMHELLGHRTPNSTEQDVGWRHFLKPKEIPWMLGHQLQNQIVMPAAGFIVMAIEAALDICPGSLPTLIEVIDVDIIKALSFASEETSVEVVFFLTDVVRTEKSVSGNFKCSASESKGAQPLELIVSGSVKIHLDGHSDHILPPRGSRPGNLIKLFDKEFYKFAREVEYQYTGPFEALDMLERKHGAVRGVIHDIEATKLLIHPAVLDAAFQALSIAFASPGDGTIRTLHVPKTIQVVRIVPHLCMRELNVGASLPFDAVHPREITEMMGDIDIYPSTSPANAMVQVQGLKCVPFSRSNKNDDKETFFTVSWDVAQPEARLVGSVGGPNQNSTSTNGTKYQEEGNPSADPNGIVDSQSDLIICLVSIIKQIVHRYPHMHIFHVETSEVATVAVTLEEIDTSFSTYTLTAPSSNLLNEVKPFADTYGDRLLLRKFDPVQDADEQEFEKGAYDLVVSSSFARPSLSEQELQNYRYLLRPGGYLVALDRIEPNDCPATFVADSLLRKTGFSGLDTTTSLAEETGVMHLVFASQAVDERISFLRNPLSDPRSSIFASELLVNDLIILDGKDARTAELGVQIQNLLAPYCNNITSVKSWHDLSQIPTSPKTTVVGLDGLDQSALQCLDHSEWDSLKTTLLSIGLFVWVTAGRLAGSPHANMLVGLMRSVVRDVPGLDYHILDFEDKTDIEASPIAESLLRFKASLLWLRQGHLKVTPETEILVDGRGRAMIPRLKLSKTLNDRYNSGQRKILASATPYSERLQLRPSSTDPSYELIYETRTIGRKTTDIRGTVRVTHSLLSAVRITEYGSLFLVLGRYESSGKQVVVLSTTLSSYVRPWSRIQIPVEIQDGDEAKLLSHASHHILAQTILDGLGRGDRVWIHQPESAFAGVLAKYARSFGIHVVFSAMEVAIDRGRLPHGNSQWIMLPSMAPERIILPLLSGRISAFVNMATNDQNQAKETGYSINKLLPSICRKYDLDSLLGTQAWHPSLSRAAEISRTLKTALTQSLRHLSEFDLSNEFSYERPINLHFLTDPKAYAAPDSTVDWTVSSRIPVNLEPADSLVAFPPDKTYWLVGLTGTLGLSLCEWIIRHGARHIVVSSRKPNVDRTWIEEMTAMGAMIKISSCDVTSRQDIVRLYDDICSSMPPIVGVVQGAMVLKDTSFQDMTLDDFLEVTRPKVEGSVHLNDIFQEDTLDFFVFFSSVIGIIGRPGQANYSAANMFMASLAEKRRRQGLAASVMHIGPVRGVGYATQLGDDVFTKAKMRSAALIPMSETDVHQMFAEAILASRPEDSPDCTLEVMAGVRRVSQDEPDQPMWQFEPLMNHLVKVPENFRNGSEGLRSKIPIKTRLGNAGSREEVVEIVQEALLPRICNLFQMDPTKMDAKSAAKARLDQMGIDSLMAVELRGWLVNTFEVNVPVLRILSGISIGDLTTIVTDSIPPELVPKCSLNVNVEETANMSSSMEVETAGDSSKPLDARQQPEHIGARPKSSQSTNADASIDTRTDLDNAAPYPTVLRSFKLSFSQEMFWFVWKYLPDKTTLNHVGWTRISGKISAHELDSAIRFVGQRHESLRTCFFEETGEPRQGIMESSRLGLEVKEIQDKNEVFMIASMLRETYVFDIARGETLRVLLLSLSSTEHFVVMGLHPLVMDATSVQIFFEEMLLQYTQPGQFLDRKAPQFVEFSERQRAIFASGGFADELRFWVDEFTMPPPPLPILNLSRATSRPSQTSYENVKASLSIELDTKSHVQAVCRAHGVTPFIFYLSILRVLLLRYSPAGENEARDVTIGVSDSNRVEHEMTKCIGPFVNLLPVRLHANTSIPFVQLLQEARNKTRSALANSRLPYGALMNELPIPRLGNSPSLFQCFINYRQDLKQPTSLPDGSKAYPLVSDIARLSYDVSLDIVDSVKGDAELNLLLRKDLYGWDDARILAKSFGRLVNTFSKNPSLCLDEANMFEPSELQGAMRFSRGPTWPTTWSGTILHKIDEVTQRRNDEIALHCGNVKYTYKQMCEQTNQIAAALKGAGVGFGSPVAVLQEPSAGGICSFLGILRVGGIYVPLEPSMPTPRLASVVQDSRPSVILVDHRTKYMLDDLRPQMKVIDVSETFPPSKTVPNTASVDGLAAILYTSGSSGTPKGILVTHRGLLNWAEPIAQLYGLGIEKVLQQTTPTFDLSFCQIISALCLGGSLHLVPRQQRGDGRAISELISRHGITFTCATPSEYASWLHYGKEELASCSMWRTAIAIGEPMPESLVWQFALRNSPAFALWNLYGPTETTITATSMCIPLQSFSSGDDTAFESEGPPAAGRPHPNYSVYVLDERLRPVPAGIQGEIYIGGPSVARGYVNQPELTVERFVPDVFASEEDRKHGWTMLHRTGDLGRWRSDGALLVEGRMAGDTQVKLRGLRIDLGEVEHAIVDCASGIFQEAAVSLREAADGTSGFLVAHVVINEAWQKQLQSPDDIELEISTIQRRLSDRLPQYMCPAGLLVVPSLPLTTSAKLDRKALGLLPLPQFSHAPEKSPTEDVDQDGSSHEHDIMTTTEIRLQDVWLDVLSAYIGGRKITPVTDFFHVGGSSILLLRLRSQIREVFGVDMPLIRMFEQSTLDGMARWIDHGNQVPGQKPESIDWDKETELLDSVLRVETRLNISSFRDPEIAAKTVILTGATGLLGNALLNAMVDNPFIKHIHCIAVREPLKHPHLASMDRVTLYKGDLTKPRLGLSDTDANELFSSSDAVIHCAADMSYLKTYASLRSANVQSTKEIAAMSAHTGRMVPIHYISSIGVGTIPAAVIDGYQNKSQSEDFIFRPVSVAAYKPINPCSSLGNGRQAQSTGGGYAASKWASEVFLERLSVQHPRWQITIHRPSFITPDAWDGRLSNLSDLRDQPVISPTTNSNGSSLELLQNLRHYARLLGNVLPIIPDGRMSGTWDLVPVGKVVEDVMQQLLLEISDGEQTQFQVLHHVGEVEMQLTGMSDWIKTDKETQERVQEMDLAEWASAAGEKGMHPIMVAMLQNFAVADGTVRFARVSSK